MRMSSASHFQSSGKNWVVITAGIIETCIWLKIVPLSLNFLNYLIIDTDTVLKIISYLPATTKDVATNESIAAEYCGSLSDKNFDVNRQSNVATPSTIHP